MSWTIPDFLGFLAEWLPGYHVDLFPPRPEDPSKLHEICIGTKSLSLGDALVLTPLPRLLKQRYPGMPVHVYRKGLNRQVFAENPHVDGAACFPRTVYGDDANWGEGHAIQAKARFFDLPVDPDPKPEVYLTERERRWATGRRSEVADPGRETLPICVIHPWGRTRSRVLPVDAWDRLVAEGSRRTRFWQVGLRNDSAVRGCEYYFLFQPGEVRRLLAIVSVANSFIGVDSGPMHVARAFDLPSAIFLDHLPDPDSAIAARQVQPFFRERSRLSAFLYRSARLIDVSSPDPIAVAEDFLSRLPAIPQSFDPRLRLRN